MDFTKKVITPAIVNFSKTFNLLEKYEQTTRLSTIKAVPGQQPLLIPSSHFAGKNMWILKAVSLNRGQGIYVISSLKDCKDKIAKMCQDRSLSKESHFVIQKYIEAPLLINSRKFDIRVWVLVT